MSLNRHMVIPVAPGGERGADRQASNPGIYTSPGLVAQFLFRTIPIDHRPLAAQHLTRAANAALGEGDVKALTMHCHQQS